MTGHHATSSAGFRYLPFAVFMAFIGLEELIRFLAGHGFFTLGATTLYYLYPIKALAVGFMLYAFRENYCELVFKDLTNLPSSMGACGTGLLVFVLWINMDWTFDSTGVPLGFDPTLLPGRTAPILLTSIRIVGAVLVVPLMEELFWRSFLIRYIIDYNFCNIRIGTFSWTSFIFTVVLFGLEHNYFYAGLMAGCFYNLLLYRTRSIAQCVLAHAVSNLALSIYVVSKGAWQFW